MVKEKLGILEFFATNIVTNIDELGGRTALLPDYLLFNVDRLRTIARVNFFFNIS